MILDSLWMQGFVALLGGIAVELLHWYGLARRPDNAKLRYAKRPIYWVTTAGMILLGGVMPVLYISGAASALLCFHLGAATPLLLQKLVASVPAVAVPQGANQDRMSMRDFFRW